MLKKCLEDKKRMWKRNEDEDEPERTDDGCKWVKTDSECKFILTLIHICQWK